MREAEDAAGIRDGTKRNVEQKEDRKSALKLIGTDQEVEKS